MKMALIWISLGKLFTKCFLHFYNKKCASKLEVYSTYHRAKSFSLCPQNTKMPLLMFSNIFFPYMLRIFC